MNIVYRMSTELFLISNKLVACQTAYAHPGFENLHQEIKHYYCPNCGDVWGMRIDPEQKEAIHYYYSSKCRDCGGTNNMLTPFENSNLLVLGANVLAYLFLQETEEKEKDHEIQNT